jgi:NAD(P)-dependent dehydrogenase (short-subunit alcohol dehydrogenase family)
VPTLAGLRAVVTGSASGIGAATAARLQADGARVAGIDLRADPAAGHGLAAYRPADVSDASSCASAIDDLAGQLGGLDLVVACAGVAGRGNVEETTPHEWDRVFGVNVRGVYLTGRAAIPHLRRAGGGAIVNVASQLGIVAARGAVAYCASKGAVIQLTKAMALDYGAEGIRVNCVCPGPTETPMLESFFAASDDPAAERRVFEQAQVHGRLVRPEEIADAIAYLASPSAGSTNGAALVVDAGYIIH